MKEAAILREKAEAMGDGEEEKAKTLDMLAKIDDKLAKQASSDSGSNGPIEYTVREWHPYNGYEKPKCVDAQVGQETSQQFFCLLKEIQKYLCSRAVTLISLLATVEETLLSK